MIKSKIWDRKIAGERDSFFHFIMVLVIGLSLGGGTGILVAYSIPKVLPGVNKLGAAIGTFGIAFWGLVIGSLLMALIIFLRQDGLAATIVIAVSLILDWYLGTYIMAPLLAFLLLVIFFLAQSPQRPWIVPRALWLWIMFLLVTISPAIQGAITPYDTLTYYPNLIFGALIVFWLGTVIARDIINLRRFFQILAGFGTLIAIHIIIEAFTGNLFFATSNVQSFLDSTSYYQLGNTGVSRLASFFIQPDAGSAFLAMMLFIPLGLFVESSSFVGKAFYFVETLLILIALLFTYSTIAWFSATMGIIAFAILVRSFRYRFQISLSILLVLMVLFVKFPSQIDLLLQHSSSHSELSIRQGLWNTALLVIRAFPSTGIGLSRLAYLHYSYAYIVPEQIIPQNNPHNSYLELGAMGGLPVLIVFLALLGFNLWEAIRNWVQVDRRTGSLLGAGIAAIIVMSINSWGFGVWTLAPLAVPGWLLLGVISSPLLSKGPNDEMIRDRSIGIIINSK